MSESLFTIRVKNVRGDISERGEYVTYESAKDSLIFWAHTLLSRHPASVKENRPIFNDNNEMQGWHIDFGGHIATLDIIKKDFAY